MALRSARVAIVGVLALPLTWVACTSFSSDNSAPGDAADGSAADGSAADSAADGAAPDPDAGSADAAPLDAGYLLADGFESDANACTGWSSLKATLTVDTATVRTGSRSCKVCPNGSGLITTIVSSLLPITKAGNYQLDFWAQAATAGVLGSGGIQPYDGDGGILQGNFPAVAAVSSTDWTHIHIVGAVTDSARSAKVQGNFSVLDAAQCVFVDDVTFGPQ
jgi:hypothetical protein